MNIGIIGIGKLGSELGRRWTTQGLAVFFGSHEPKKALRLGESMGVMASGGTIAQAAQFGSIILLALPWEAVPRALQAAGSLSGKVIIDCTNPMNSDWTQLVAGLTSSGAERIAELAPGARVVKAFNHAYAQVAQFCAPPCPSVLYCGDDAEAKAKVACLIKDAGFEAVDAGALRNARDLEPIAEQIVQFAYVIGRGMGQPLKIMRR